MKEFKFHVPKNEQIATNHGLVREKCDRLAHELMTIVPDSEELKVALIKLREVMMWSNAGIAIHQ